MQANPSACQAARRAPPRSSRQACRQIPVHARRARRPPGAARPASPAELVAVALSPLSCSRESRTLPAAFLALPLPLNAPAWLSQNAIAVSGGPPGATALSCSHPPQESTRMHRSTLRRLRRT